MSVLKSHFICFVLCSMLLLGACKQPSQVKHQSPRNLFPELFEAVQSGHVFEDSKTFTDCTPKKDPAAIVREYRERRDRADFNLRSFVDENFNLPEQSGSQYKSTPGQDVESHINELWGVLQRNPDKYSRYSSLIGLPFPYIVPGGRFREIYYWDSYFTMLGLQESRRTDLAESMVNNFAFLIRTYGFIPNGNRTYYLTRSQPPYFSLMVKLLMEMKPGKGDSVLRANRDALEKEYYFWMDGKGKSRGVAAHVVWLPDGIRLNRYYDAGDWPREEAYTEDAGTAVKSGRPHHEVYRDLRSGAESGWDFSSRWQTESRSLGTIRTTDIVPVDLNCLLYHLEQMLALAYEKSGEQKAQRHMQQAADSRKAAIIRYCRDAETGWYTDYDWKNSRSTGKLTLAGVYPLYFGLVTAGQADSAAAVLRTRFLKPGGLVTTLEATGQQWDAPNGWAPLQWMAIAGLRNYGKEALASEIASRWSGLNIRVFNKTGKLLEKYNVTDTTVIAGGGEYPNQDGFGWTNGVLLKILKIQQQGSRHQP